MKGIKKLGQELPTESYSSQRNSYNTVRVCIMPIIYYLFVR